MDPRAECDSVVGRFDIPRLVEPSGCLLLVGFSSTFGFSASIGSLALFWRAMFLANMRVAAGVYIQPYPTWRRWTSDVGCCDIWRYRI